MLISQHHKKILLLVLLIIYPFLWVWQGLDFSDFGYWITAYQQLFSFPDGLSDISIVSWGTVAIGHLWHQLFGEFGYVSFRVAYAIVIVISIYIAYAGLKDFIGDNEISFLLIIFISMVLIMKKSAIIGYNNLTGLFYLVGGILILHALFKKKSILIFIAGLIIGYNSYIRLPNLIGIILITSIWIYGYVNKWRFKQIITFTSLFIVGYCASIVFGFFLMKSLGHLEHYKKGIISIFWLADTKYSHHSSNLFLIQLIRDYFLALLSAIVIFVFSLPISKVLANYNKKIQWIFILTGCILISPILNIKHIGDWFFPGVIFIVLSMNLIHLLINNDNKFILSYVALIILAISYLGSNNGMWNARHGMWIALPLTLTVLSNIKSIKWRNIYITNAMLQIIQQSLKSLILIYAFITLWVYTYHDNKNRLELIHEPKHKLLNNVFTTKERANSVEELLQELSKYVSEDEFLLAYNKIPTIYYLTKAKPWLDHPWPMNIHPTKLTHIIKDKEKKRNLPVIVRALGDTSSADWPNVEKIIPDNWHAYKESAILMDSFIERNAYNSVWKNNFFEILTSPYQQAYYK